MNHWTSAHPTHPESAKRLTRTPKGEYFYYTVMKKVCACCCCRVAENAPAPAVQVYCHR